MVTLKLGKVDSAQIAAARVLVEWAILDGEPIDPVIMKIAEARDGDEVS